MNSPVQIERLFQELLNELPKLLSKRARFDAITVFLVRVGSPNINLESYLEQLIPFLPKFTHPYEYTGLHPEWFEEKLEVYNQYFIRKEIQNHHQVISSFDSLGKAHQEVLNWIGGYFGEKQKTTLFANQNRIQRKIHTVLVPVIEQTGTDYSGRLRNMEVSVVGASNSGKHDLVPVFSVIGEEARSEALTKNPEAAVNLLLEGYELSTKTKWQATVGFEHKLAWHTGRSANLAMAGLFFCSILEAMELREQFRLNPAVVITGDISKAGEVLPVSKETLKPKLEAAFFSWAHVLVISQEQAGEVFHYYEKLKEEFPKRELLIVPVSKLGDLFYDRRLTLHARKSRLEYVSQQLWKRKFKAVSLVTIFFLMTIVALLAIGPIDKNPTHYEFTENAIVLKNEYGRQLNSIEVDEFNIENGTTEFPSVKHNLVEFFDVDKDGENEILLGLQSDSESQIGTFTLLESNAKDTIWHRRLDFDVPYEKHPYAYHKNYRPINFEILDIEGDGDFEIIANLQQYYYFKNILGIFDAHSGEPEQQFNTAGWLSVVLSNDFDKDGTPDAVICGLYKGWNKGGCMIIGLDDINGFAPLHERYLDKEKPLAPIKLAFQIPYTMVGKVERTEINSITPNVTIPRAYSTKSRELIMMNVADVAYPAMMNKTYLGLIYDFDYHFNLLSIGSGDAYDRRALELYESGKTPFLADAQYLHSFRDSLLWFDGDNWVQEPTLNKYFLEKMGEDSSYYKEWYFRKD